MGYNVAIDGPAGAGKSTIAKLVAKEKGYIYVDTGAMYRAMAVYFLQEGISPQDTEKIRLAAQNADVSICYEDGIQQVYLNGSNITDRLREEAVGNMASVSSAVREVRARLLDLQRNLAKEADVIMDGRDIGTNILPNADVKIYLTASVKTRADRRYKELTEKGISCSYEEIAEDIKKRDERDMSRETAPLKQAEDAILIDSSDMSIRGSSSCQSADSANKWRRQRMNVKRAKTAGFCFGVKRAVETVYEQAKNSDAAPIYTYGPIIHNEEVVKDLENQGVIVLRTEQELEQLTEGTVIIRSHGVAKYIYEKLEKKKIQIVDATCPFVKKIHRIVSRESAAGKQIVIIGNPKHPEVEGIRGWAGEQVFAVETKEDAASLVLDSARAVCVVAQTTFNYNKFQDLVEINFEKEL